MKKAKRIGIGLLIILGLLLILGLFLSKDVHIESSRNFTAPPSYVFNLINELKNVSEYNAWIKEDAAIVLNFGDVTAGKGAFYEWESPNSGKGKIEYIGSYPSDSIVAKMQFEGMDESRLVYSFKGSGDKTKVTWTMDSRLGFPFNLMKWFFKRSIRKGHEQTFDLIEGVLSDRKSGVYGGYQIQDVMEGERSFIMNRDNVKSEKIQRFYMQNLGPIFKKIQDQGISMAGSPCGLFFSHRQNEIVDMAAGIPVLEPIEMEGLTSYSILKGRALKVDYYGDYDKTLSAHTAINQYALDRDMTLSQPAIEEYKTDPTMEKDPNKWLTQITNYVEQN